MSNLLWKYGEKTRCAACREWIEAGFDNRIWDKDRTYHWQCYWRIVWPQKARMAKRLKMQAK
ncbi:MAG: hypothetical protein HGA84_06860 [Syntrophobacteraceae bacterium]|nr:hypothetical protein [Syntrophobacteraceae bacterium]